MQFLKFQAFAEQLTKETQDLKVKIESHKRENRRLTSLIEQQKDDTARLTGRLSGTEKQRDAALDALVEQQDLAEKLERERKRNEKELSALQHTNTTITRQRDESRRVVLHLRSLIDGQTHHMEHIVRSLNKAPELSDYIEEGYEDTPEDASDRHSEVSNDRNLAASPLEPESRRSLSAASSHDGSELDNEAVAPEMESRFFSPLLANGRPGSRLSMSDVADRHLRDKTDAIAYIIRNISDQCAAAVEGLQLAQHADTSDVDGYGDHTDHLDPELSSNANSDHTDSRKHSHTHSNDDANSMLGEEHDSGHGGSTGHLTPRDDTSSNKEGGSGGRQSRASSIPPTPDLIGGGRSSTSMSGYSNSTAPTVAGRDSLQWSGGQTGLAHDVGKGMRVVEAGDEELGVVEETEVLGKGEGELRVGSARVVGA